MFTIDPRQATKVATPDTGQKTLFLDESDSVLKTKDDAGVVEALATSTTVQDALDAQVAAGPKVYKALLNQSGTNAPVATVLENTLGDTIDFTYAGPGAYLWDFNTITPLASKVLVYGAPYANPEDEQYITFFPYQGNTPTSLRTYEGGFGVNLLLNITFIVEVYP